jgi:phage FluMu protein gp41
MQSVELLKIQIMSIGSLDESISVKDILKLKSVQSAQITFKS